MRCSEFESRISEYLDGELGHPEGSAFREHALSCRTCRSLLDQIGSAIAECKTSDPFEPPSQLEAALQSIPSNETPFDCEAYLNLITEFLDGFVPAATYHRFANHAADCDDCSALLTDVVYAVAACHSVHTYEDYDIPSTLTASLVDIAPQRRQSLAHSFASWVRTLVDSMVPVAAPGAGRSFAMGLFLAGFTFISLLFGFSQDGTIGGIYRQARVKATEVYDRGARAYSEKERVAAKLEEVRSDIGEIWDTLGGDDELSRGPERRGGGTGSPKK
jgi:predicted anti-sigma-YlaC factor YlaD